MAVTPIKKGLLLLVLIHHSIFAFRRLSRVFELFGVHDSTTLVMDLIVMAVFLAIAVCSLLMLLKWRFECVRTWFLKFNWVALLIGVVVFVGAWGFSVDLPSDPSSRLVALIQPILFMLLLPIMLILNFRGK